MKGSIIPVLLLVFLLVVPSVSAGFGFGYTPSKFEAVTKYVNITTYIINITSNATIFNQTYQDTYTSWEGNYSASNKYWINQTTPAQGYCDSMIVANWTLFTATFNSSYDSWLANYSAYSKFWYKDRKSVV